MADVITRLRVESQEYDSKLKNAIGQMQQMEREVRRTGATFAYADEEEMKFVQSLGTMESNAKSATGKIAELKQAFTELSLQYNRMTEEEKRSPYGKALSNSLGQLKARISDAQSELKGVQGELSGVGDVFSKLGGKMGIPMEMFTKLGPAVAAASAAIKIATDAFKQNEILMDEWGRITQSAGSLYQGFLNSINTGDISGFLRNIGRIISKAREAYDAMDELGTFNAFNQIQIETARTNWNDAITNYREGTGTKADVETAAQNLKNELKSRQEKEQKAYIDAIKELAASRGVDEDMLQKALSGTYGDYETLKNTQPTGERMRIVGGGRTAHAVIEKYAANETEKLGEALRKLNDEDLQRIQALGAQAQRTSTEISQIDKQKVRVLGTGRGRGTGTSAPVQIPVEPVIPEGSAAELKKKISELQQAWNLATTQDERNSIKGQIDEAQAALDAMLPKVEQVKEAGRTIEEGSLADLNNQLREAKEVLASLAPDTEAWSAALADVAAKQQAVNELQNKMGGNTAVKTQTNDVKKMSSSWSEAVSAISQVGGALQQIDDPGAKIAGIIAQAIASVASGLGQMLASPAATSEAWGWIALAISGTATMIGTIASIKSATQGYANGGMVGGNSYSGDNIVARLNSGEGVLTARGVQNAAIMASNSNSLQNLELTTDVSGTNLLIVLNNTNRSRGGDRNFYSRIH